MAEQSGKPTAGTRVRVYYSDTLPASTLEARASLIAARLEDALGMDGSSIQPQTGRWKKDLEQGYVIEIVSDFWGKNAAAEIVAACLAKLVKPLGATFYVTLEDVTCMEIF